MAAVATGTLLWLSPLGAPADTVGSVRGYVRTLPMNQPPGGPIANAMVTILSAGAVRRAHTDRRGFYVIWNLPPGNYVINAWAENHSPKSRPICVHAGDDQYVNLNLPAYHADVYGLALLASFGPSQSQTTDLYSIGAC
jgi:hypothetical protein